MESLRKAFLSRASVICIRSWNNFQTGSFVEPNSLDGETVLDALTEALARYRAGEGLTDPVEQEKRSSWWPF